MSGTGRRIALCLPASQPTSAGHASVTGAPQPPQPGVPPTIASSPRRAGSILACRRTRFGSAPAISDQLTRSAPLGRVGMAPTHRRQATHDLALREREITLGFTGPAADRDKTSRESCLGASSIACQTSSTCPADHRGGHGSRLRESRRSRWDRWAPLCVQNVSDSCRCLDSPTLIASAASPEDVATPRRQRLARAALEALTQPCRTSRLLQCTCALASDLLRSSPSYSRSLRARPYSFLRSHTRPCCRPRSKAQEP